MWPRVHSFIQLHWGVDNPPVSVRLKVGPAADWANLIFDDDAISLSWLPNLSPQRSLQLDQPVPIAS